MLLAFEDKNIVLGAGQILHHQRGVAHKTVTALAIPAPTTTAFAVSAEDAELLRAGDMLQLASDTPAYTAAEASTMPRIESIMASGSDFLVTVTPAFSGAPPSTAAGVRVLYKNLGATMGDIAIRGNLTKKKQFVDQAVDAVKSRTVSREVTITAPLAEAIIPHFAMALGITPGADPDVLQVGSTLPDEREDRIVTITPADDGKTRYTVAHRCSHEGEAALVASKENESVISLNLTLMPDTDFGAAALFDMKSVAA